MMTMMMKMKGREESRREVKEIENIPASGRAGGAEREKEK